MNSKVKSELLVPVLRVNVISNFGMPFSLHGLPTPFQRRFPARPCGVMAGYPMSKIVSWYQLALLAAIANSKIFVQKNNRPLQVELENGRS